MFGRAGPREGRGMVNAMTICSVCGNDYDKAFVVVRNGEPRVFDCFECAIHALAPVCGHCGCRVIGHGAESDGVVFCCAHCASAQGVDEMVDRVG